MVGLKSFVPGPTTLAVVGFSAVFLLLMQTSFKMKLEIEAMYSESVDPAYPYLHVVSEHSVRGKPFIHYLSRAVMEGRENVEGISIKGELEKFEGKFQLLNATGDSIVEVNMDTGSRKAAYLAVPPGGLLVFYYE